jgi:hypothetical protein
MSAQLDFIEGNVEKIMDEDAAVQAVTADILTWVQNLQALVQQILSDSQNTLSTGSLAALQAADAQLDQQGQALQAAVAGQAAPPPTSSNSDQISGESSSEPAGSAP